MIEIRPAPAFEQFVRKEDLKVKEVSLMERVIRLEEELKALREIEKAHFEATEKRFEAMDKRFSLLQWFIGIGFSVLALLLTLFRFYPR